MCRSRGGRTEPRGGIFASRHKRLPNPLSLAMRNRKERRGLVHTLREAGFAEPWFRHTASSEGMCLGGLLMRVIRAFTWAAAVCLLSLPVLMLLLNETPSVSAQTGTPPSSSISSTSGPVSWDFAAVGGGTVVNVGIQDICPPAMCDDHDLTIVLPAPAATFYQTMTARDRKSTRLNSSHVSISYAVFCLKKKKKKNRTQQQRTKDKKTYTVTVESERGEHS